MQIKTRIERRNLTYEDIGYKHSGGIFDLFDNSVKENLRINDKEYDYICEKATDDELKLVSKEKLSYKEKRELLNTLNKYLFKLYADKSA